ncbi:MAG: FAD-dependent oxidoreductase, partial [Kyrpidia tusciae]
MVKTLALVLLDLIPIGLAMLVRPAPVGLGLGLLFAAIYLGVQFRSRRMTIKTVSVVNVVYLAVAFLVLWVRPGSSLLNYAQPSIYLILSVSTLLSLVAGEPFTMQYAKQEVAPSLWENPIFIRINRRLTQLWAALFSLSLFFAVLTALHVLSEVWGYILTNVWNVLGVAAMMILPARMQRFYLTQLYKSNSKEAQWKPEYPPQRPAAPREYDVIVVGAGIGGLVTAVEVAKRGAKVLVLDQHYLPGGACTTYERKGFKFDAGVESVSGLGESGPVRHFLRRHGLDNALTWIRNVYEIRTPGFQMVIPADFEAWRDELVRRFPDEQSGIRAVFEEIRWMYREKLSVFAPDRVVPHIPKTPEAMLAFAEANPHYVRWQHTRWGEFLQHFISHPSLHQQLSMLTGYVGDDGANTPTDIMVSLMGYFMDGGYRPAGGSGELAQALVQKLKEYGGEIRLSSRVHSILTEGGRVRGVVSKTGTDFSPVVVSNVDPRVTYETLIGLENVNEEERAQVQALQPSMSLFVWNAALSRPYSNPHLLHWNFAAPKTLPQWGL